MDAAQNPDDVAMASGQAVDRAPDELEAAPPYITQREASQTVGVAPVSRTADATQSNPLSIIERKLTPITNVALWMGMVVPLMVAALGLLRFLFRRTYAKRLLAFGAMRRQPPPHYLRLVEPSRLSRHEVEADPGAASALESVNKAIGTIEQAVAEMTSSRQAPHAGRALHPIGNLRRVASE
ncbi:MAG: hypothetical protein ACJ8EF_21555 [Bradyrhizobium sp.]